MCVTLFAGKAKTWWLSFATQHSTMCDIGVLAFDDLQIFLENEFKDEDRERKLLSRFSSFV